MRSSWALISRSRSIRPSRIWRLAAARLELGFGGVSSGNETQPRSEHVLERLAQRTLRRARGLTPDSRVKRNFHHSFFVST